MLLGTKCDTKEYLEHCRFGSTESTRLTWVAKLVQCITYRKKAVISCTLISQQLSLIEYKKRTMKIFSLFLLAVNSAPVADKDLDQDADHQNHGTLFDQLFGDKEGVFYYNYPSNYNAYGLTESLKSQFNTY